MHLFSDSVEKSGKIGKRDSDGGSGRKDPAPLFCGVFHSIWIWEDD